MSPLSREERLSVVLGAVSNPTRRAIVERLAGNPMTVGEVAKPFEMSIQAVSKHLRVLESSGLIRSTREGTHRRLWLVVDVLDCLSDWVHTIRPPTGSSAVNIGAVTETVDVRNSSPWPVEVILNR